MHGHHCRLYDEELVKNIMIATGLSVSEFLRGSGVVTHEVVGRFIEENAEIIIEDTLNELNSDADNRYGPSPESE